MTATLDSRPLPAARTVADPWLVAAAVLVVGLGGGVLTEYLQGVLRDPWAMWANSVAAWVAVAFTAGAVAGRVRVAVAAGVAVQLLLTAGYYSAQVAQDLPVAWSTALGWAVAGVVGGAVFGTAGAWWRGGSTGKAVAGAALLGGVLVGEGLVRAVQFPWQGSSGVVMTSVGVAVVLLLGRTWRQRLLALAATAAVLPLGWAGLLVTEAVFEAW